MKRAALKYARAGWDVFPVHRTREAHTPLVRSWPELATHDLDTVERWWTTWPDASIATIPASMGLVAIDYDTKHGKTVEELQDALANAMGTQLAESSMIARTPSGGEHHYYRSAEAVASSNGKIVRGVDIRSASNGYILLPPSMQGQYRWVSLGEAPTLPAELAAILGQPAERVEQEWLIQPDLPENITLAKAWLLGDECRPSIEGEGGNQALYDTACMMVSFGLSEDKAVELLDEVYVAKCVPPWDHDDVVRVVGNAYRYHTSPPGNKTPAWRQLHRPDFGVVEDAKPKLVSPFRITDRDGIVALPPPEWLIEPYLVADSCAILTGGYGTYKSFIALDMALAISTATRSLWDVRQRGPVLYMLGEGRSGMGKRLRAWERHHDLALDTRGILFIDPTPHISMGEHVMSQLLDYLLTVGTGYRFVVLDTIGRAIAGQNENASETASALSAMANTLRERLGACVLAIGHTKKDRTIGQGATRGSGIFENDADTVLNVEKSGEREVVLEVIKQKDASEAEPLSLSLREVAVGAESSLVLDAGIAKKETGSPRKGSVHDLIDAIGADILSASPHDVWNTRNLATQIARDERIQLSMESIRKKLLELPARSTFRLSKMFLPAMGQGAPKWKFSPVRE